MNLTNLHKNKYCPLFLLTVIIISFLSGFFHISGIFADEIDDIQKEIDSQNETLEKINQDLEASKSKVDELSSQRGGLYWQLSNVKGELEEIQDQIDENTADIGKLNESVDRVKALIDDRLEQKNVRIKNIYYDIKVPVIDRLFGSSSLNFISKLWKYKEAGVKRDKEEIIGLNSQLAQLKDNLEESERLQGELVAVNVTLEENLDSINTQIAGINNQIYSEQQRQQALSGEVSSIQSSIADLTAYQQELIRQKLLATQFNVSVGESEQGVEYLEDAPFAGGFVFFTYGYPHRVGMNQYGAYGRALAGQNASQILGAYYSNITLDKNYDSSITITVNGCNEYGQCFNNEEMNIDDYVKHIYEMPSSWSMEALKAQAVAARTYALNYTNNGTKPICPSQSCQVIKKEMNAPAWQQAVDETEGWVVLHNGSPITAWYSSTAGGYTRSAENVWGSYRTWALGIKDYDGNGNAYDGPSWGNSPWYHKVWGDTPRGNPWLTNEETQDLFNAYLLSSHSSSYNQYLSPVDKGGWSMQKVREELELLEITPVGKISGIVTSDDGDTGFIDRVIADTAGYGFKEFDGYLFRSIYNLRSPGTLVIWTSRYDVQKS